MKKIFSVPFLLLWITSLIAQESFVIPVFSDANKHARMVFQANGFILNSINYAKSMGKTLEDLAVFTGDQFMYTWNKEEGYAGFVKGTLSNWVCFIPDAEIEILEQSDNMIKFRTREIYPDLKAAGSFFNVSYEEYLSFTRIIHERIAGYLGAQYTQEVTPEGLVVTIQRNQ
jgi:hypothetical protein